MQHIFFKTLTDYDLRSLPSIFSLPSQVSKPYRYVIEAGNVQLEPFITPSMNNHQHRYTKSETVILSFSCSMAEIIVDNTKIGLVHIQRVIQICVCSHVSVIVVGIKCYCMVTQW